MGSSRLEETDLYSALKCLLKYWEKVYNKMECGMCGSAFGNGEIYGK